MLLLHVANIVCSRQFMSFMTPTEIMICPNDSVSFVSKEFDSGIVNLVAADPLDACYSVNNGQALHGAIALVERG